VSLGQLALARQPAGDSTPTLTWDQGPEMRDWKHVSVDADIEIYFCDPHAPCQRATNENTNGLLRQYFPVSRRGRARRLGHGRKRSLAVREFGLAIEALERFVRREPLYRVHERVFAVPALQSEPVDARL
jgi:transposase InsO family protein